MKKQHCSICKGTDHNKTTCGRSRGAEGSQGVVSGGGLGEGEISFVDFPDNVIPISFAPSYAPSEDDTFREMMTSFENHPSNQKSEKVEPKRANLSVVKESVDPKTLPVKYLSVTETARQIRKDLKEEFPGVKFSVRSSKYAGGASIDVAYEGGPGQRSVSDFLNTYQATDFDGMTDSTSYRTPKTVITVDGEKYRAQWGSDHVFARRTPSDEDYKHSRAYLSKAFGKPIQDEEVYDSPPVRYRYLPVRGDELIRYYSDPDRIKEDY